MKVLIVDDDPVSLRLLRNYLEKWGYEVTHAQNGAAAWALFQSEDFPLIIADWMMPEMDGLELVRRIRASDRSGYVYCILLTARAHKEDLVEGMDAGADDFVSKPFDRDELRVRLREGERIVTLERNAAQLAQTPREAPPAPQASGRAPDDESRLVGAVQALETALASASEQLTALRSQVAANTAPLVDQALERLADARHAAEQLRGGS
jgi:DNA-binding response OmpR family regulator